MSQIDLFKNPKAPKKAKKTQKAKKAQTQSAQSHPFRQNIICPYLFKCGECDKLFYCSPRLLTVIKGCQCLP